MSVGKPLPHDAARLHVTGAARYVDDIPCPAGTLHLAFGLSRAARARIMLDLAPVRAAAGVALVLGPGDLAPMPDCSPSAHDEPLLALGEVFYAGHPLFIVAADSHLAARKAAALGPRCNTTPILRSSASRTRWPPTAGSRTARASTPRAIQTPSSQSADHVIEGRIEIGGQEHFYLEGQAALAVPGEDGAMTVHASTQHPTEIQHKVAEALGQPMHAVRVETRRMGGGFGGKESQGNHLAIACAIGRRAHRPPGQDAL